VCGICGSTSDPNGLAVAAMCRSLRHRGPDEESFYLSPGGEVSIGVRRLSVIDLADGRQPRGNEDGTVQVAFNGEIYNHPQIREQLLRDGHALRGHCDTEVLPHLYEDHGVDLVHLLEGMFALAIWDSRRERLLLARDRFGEKPLFYARQGSGLVFASELTALRAGLASTPEVAAAALDACFVLGYVPRASGSILEGVEQLPPAHLLSWDRRSGQVERRAYWSPPRPRAEPRESPRELAAEAGRLLRRSVTGRLRADVSLGVFLSGGIDSTLAAALAAEQSSGRLKTFTVGYEGAGEGFDERAAARRIGALIDSEHREVVVGENELVSGVAQLLGGLDQPLADPAVVPLHWVARLAGEEVRVAIGGEGADELFGGYPRYGWLGRAPTAWPWTNPDAVAAAGSPRLWPAGSRRWRAVDLLRPRPPAERQLDWVSAGRAHARRRLYGPRLQAQLARTTVLSDLRGELDGSRCSSVAASLMRLDQLNWLPDDVLVKADRASMLASLELRTPYLDRGLAEFAAGVGPRVHLAGGGKRLLRLLLSQLLPGAPQRRRKIAFLPPVASWLRGPLGAAMERQIGAGSLYAEGWVRADVAARLLAEHRCGRADRSAVLWPLLAVGLWLDRFRGDGVA
jgi:asparagine synthase (glutamine-hydrolysing)